MLTIKMDGLDDLRKKLAETPRRIEIVAQRALLKTAQAIKQAEEAEMRRVFDRPTRWTLGAMKVKPTAKMEVSVGILDSDGFYRRASNYLGTEITGGLRRMKAFEKALQQYGLMPVGWVAMPGAGAKIDAYGNMSPGQIRQILSWFDAAERWAGSTQNMRAAGREKRRRGTRKSAGFEYFVVLPGRQRNLKQPGIYQRFFFGHGKAIKPVLIYVTGAKYRALFNFVEVAERTAARVMGPELESALEQELLR